MTPVTALQKALVSHLRASASVGALAEQRVYDRVPRKADLPYVHVGEMQRVEDGGDCYSGCEVFATLHAWTETFGAVECRELAGAVTAALDGVDIPMSAGWRLVEIILQDERTFEDPNGINTHGVITFRAHVEPA